MKIKQSETVEISRSQIDFAPYNPREDSPEVVEEIKNNFRKVGFLGGIVWNEATGLLISGHKRIQAMDLIFKYPAKDYQVKVEKVNFDEKTEIEQNIFMNNDAVQSRFDYGKLAIILPKIDIKNTGLTEFHIDKIKVFTTIPNIVEELKPIQDKKRSSPDEIKKLKELKHGIKKDLIDKHNDMNNSHLTIVFNNWDDKVMFCESNNIDIDSKFITIDEFIKCTENG